MNRKITHDDIKRTWEGPRVGDRIRALTGIWSADGADFLVTKVESLATVEAASTHDPDGPTYRFLWGQYVVLERAQPSAMQGFCTPCGGFRRHRLGCPSTNYK